MACSNLVERTASAARQLSHEHSVLQQGAEFQAVSVLRCDRSAAGSGLHAPADYPSPIKTEWCGQLQIMLKRRHILSDEGVHLRANTFPGPCTAAKSSPATKTK